MLCADCLCELPPERVTPGPGCFDDLCAACEIENDAVVAEMFSPRVNAIMAQRALWDASH